MLIYALNDIDLLRNKSWSKAWVRNSPIVLIMVINRLVRTILTFELVGEKNSFLILVIYRL